jgi:hypothetical protein
LAVKNHCKIFSLCNGSKRVITSYDLNERSAYTLKWYLMEMNKMQPYGSFARLFSPDELANLHQYFDGARGRVPSWHAAFALDPNVDYKPTTTDHLTNEAVCRVESAKEGAQWLESLKPRLMPVAGHSAIASAMAELRCYGALLEAGYDVVPVPTAQHPTPDFEVRGPKGCMFVEVASKQEDGDQTKISQQIADGETPEGVERGTMEERHGVNIKTTERVVHPFGAPNPNKPEDSTQANAISRLCAVKGKETQAQDSTTLLWIDLRELGQWPEICTPDQFDPINTGRRGGALTSGFIWYALYGWKGAPIFEEVYSGQEKIVIMGHNGRFSDREKYSRYAGVVVCIPKATAFFENPYGTAPLTNLLRIRLHALPWFDIARSVASWAPNLAGSSTNLSRKMIEAFHAERQIHC